MHAENSYTESQLGGKPCISLRAGGRGEGAAVRIPCTLGLEGAGLSCLAGE